MKLESALVFEELKEQFPEAEFHTNGRSLLLGRPLLYSPGRKTEPERLYVAEGPEQPASGGRNAWIYTQREKPAELSGVYLWLPQDLAQVFNQVQKIYDRYEAWEQQMQQLESRPGSLRTLLLEGQKMLGNPLALLSADFTLRAQTGMKQNLFERKASSIDFFNSLRQDEFYARNNQERQPYLLPASIIPYRSWNINLFQEEEMVCRLLLLEQDRSLRKCDGFLLQQMAPHISRMLEAEGGLAQPNHLHNIFHRILSDRTADYMEMSSQLEELGWAAEDIYFCVVLKISADMDQKTSANFLCGYLEQTYRFCCSLPFRDRIAAFFDISKIGKSLREISKELKYFIRESFLKAGYSRCMIGHNNLHRQYLQARIALETGSREKPYLWIHHFNGAAFPYLLEQGQRRLPSDMVWHEGVLALRQHDQQYGTEYLRTLWTYMEAQYNAAQAAQRLFIHRSTFLKRLERIKKLMNSSLDDMDERIYLAFSFRLLDAQNKSKHMG